MAYSLSNTARQDDVLSIADKDSWWYFCVAALVVVEVLVGIVLGDSVMSSLVRMMVSVQQCSVHSDAFHLYVQIF